MSEQTASDSETGTSGERRQGAVTVPPTPASQSVPQTFRIPLSQGEFALVDAADFEALSAHRWYLHKAGNRRYAARRAGSGLGRKIFYMHREVAGEAGLDVDHIDGDGLNNTRANLRACTRKQNLANKQRSVTNKSGFKGVWERNGTYRATISVEGRSRHLGPFPTAQEAADAYAVAARDLHGEYARHDGITARSRSNGMED